LTPDLLLYAPMRAEARALRRGLPAGTPVRRTGCGPRRAARALHPDGGHAAVAVAGIAGGLVSGLRPGDLVVATEVRRLLVDDTVVEIARCPEAESIAATLRRAGCRVHLGPVLTGDRLTDGARRRRLAGCGALVVDTESAVLLAGDHRPVACVRAVADTVADRLFRPVTLARVWAALRALPPVGAALVGWAAVVPRGGGATERARPAPAPGAATYPRRSVRDEYAVTPEHPDR
jgi:4-hydroxy-3-methylbut-2-enyl diphosphate reductase